MVSYKLTYFDSRGNGEIARQVFKYANREFIDERVSQEEWMKMKQNTPFGQLPILEVDGKQLAQSVTIVRFLSKQFGISGRNSWEEAQIDSLSDQFKDYRIEARAYFRVKMGFGEGDLEKLKKDIFIPSFNKMYTTFTNYLKTSGSGYLIGDSLTWIDLAVAQHSSDLLEADKNILKEFPEMADHQRRIHDIPNIRKWIAERPVSSR
ncbi:CRE-GST-9 protein [Caenorhabditis remanei]|uniref:glutathione transferase n=2 Tax=Caenorhabditis remanei TaxID=31234 RepID=E3M492_CAERE|nr:CRE-GST-9 protein [Caenorhabditis remanei]